ncbi:L,D-transpeptidase family protein [Thiorhodococcus mannitoliphagus]|uniref:L,D-transpeptidase family protein n=1 Tax=Thiorhodococcus mannitoliphagus TaxID=329406 RepID=A0A6P1E4A2_9GAMM|nr:L,D-transpeptidase family protein [Thiorhodococcus mannitoliphagus]NEX22844.1 L,D-transpeptidase family protein [Thiorhodococcus mannitoliphagus]
MKFALFLRFLVVVFAFAPGAGSANALLVSTLDALGNAKNAVVGQTPLLSGPVLAAFYAQRGNDLLWGEAAQRQALLEVIQSSSAEGLSPSDFHVELVRGLAQEPGFEDLSEPERLQSDILLSDALLRYVHHTRFGKLDPKAVDPKWNDRAPVPAEVLLTDMHGALDAPHLGRFLSSRMTQPFWYQDLKKALANLTSMEHLKGLPPLPSGPNLAKGSRGSRVALLRERLQLMGHHDDVATPEELELFDDSLVETVKEFQRRAGLHPDGVVGPRTLTTINDPIDEAKIEQVRINLERMRWLYDDLPPDYIFVDVANYMADLVRGGEVTWSTRVIVGTEKDQTPMFRDSMEHLVFNPTWSVPVSIQKKMGNVSAKYTLVDRRTGRKVSGGNASDYKRYRVVQKPGPRNALGQVKFMFPNRHAVYLHDTPSRGLFGRSSRALSHGCVRVQNPVKLAELLLGESGWSSSRIQSTIKGARTRYVNLDDHLPVLLYYLTARANENGGVYFRKDIYGRDPALRDAFAKKVTSARIAFAEPSPIPAPEQAPAQKPAINGGAYEEDQDGSESSPVPAPPSEPVRLTQSADRDA